MPRSKQASRAVASGDGDISNYERATSFKASIEAANAKVGGASRAVIDGRTPLPSGSHHQKTLVIKRDGEAVAFGNEENGRCFVPARPSGTRYVAAAAGGFHSLLMRDDGEVVAFGHNGYRQCTLRARPGYLVRVRIQMTTPGALTKKSAGLW